MSAPIAFAIFVVMLGLAGAFFHELVERTSHNANWRFWLRVMYRTFSWACLGLAGILLTIVFELSTS